MSRAVRLERVIVILIAVLLPVQMTVVAARTSPAPSAPADEAAHADGSPVRGGAPSPEGTTKMDPDRDASAVPAPTASDAAITPPVAAPDTGEVAEADASSGSGERSADRRAPAATGGAREPAAAVAAGARDPARDRFERAHPAHATATQEPDDPATTRWAVIVGINDHEGRTRDNVASRQDAEDLGRLLLGLGWRSDHVLVLTDRAATREGIEQALRWLARKTDEHSVSVVHYSGHTKQWDHDVDGDGEVVDEGLWPSDNRFITDRRFVGLLDGVAGRLWVNIAACEAAGLADPGLARAGRVLTLSSREDEKSYEDPSVANSVWGWFMIEEALSTRYADADDDGEVTIQEAFAFAAPRAERRTSKQSYGPQRPVMVDRVGEPFSLRLPQPDHGQREPDDDRCTLGICFGDDRR